MKSGVYKIINLVTDKVYIGSAVNLNNRRNFHFSKYQHNIHLKRAIEKYGIDSFKFEVLEYCQPEFCVQREQYYLDILLFAQEYIKSNHEDRRFRELGYNINPIAGNSLGQKRNRIACIETANKNRGKRRSLESRKRMSEGQLKVSKKKSITMKRTASDLEYRKRMSENGKKNWKNSKYRDRVIIAARRGILEKSFQERSQIAKQRYINDPNLKIRIKEAIIKRNANPQFREYFLKQVRASITPELIEKRRRGLVKSWKRRKSILKCD